MKLTELTPGQRGLIVKIDLLPAVKKRLEPLGIREGELIELVRRAPLHDPLEFLAGGNLVALRRTEAMKIEVARHE